MYIFEAAYIMKYIISNHLAVEYLFLLGPSSGHSKSASYIERMIIEQVMIISLAFAESTSSVMI